MKATFQTRLELDTFSQSILETYAALLGRVSRTLFAKIQAGHKAGDLKTPFLKQFEITARQFNACRVSLEGKIASIKERNKQRIKELTNAIEFLEKKIPTLTNREKKHQKKRRLAILQTRVTKLHKSLEKPSLCFGSKKLFRAQFALAENGFASQEEWKEAWQKERNSEIFVLGSKDETCGNQSCVAMHDKEEGLFSFRLRLPNALHSFGKYLLLPKVRFAYGHHEILNALQRHTAIAYRFKKDSKGWRLFATIEREKAPVVTDRRKGAVGVDMNADHVALVETDRFGNPIYKKTIPLVTYGKNHHQVKARIGDLSKEIAAYAQQVQKPLVIEELNFQKKKCALREYSSRYARMLSSFTYSATLTLLCARAAREGVEVMSVNPVFTSLIGRINFAKRYGLSIHHSAALVIARRFLGFSENPSRAFRGISDGKGGQVAFSLPERNREKHVWSFWAEASKKLRAALAEHFSGLKDPRIRLRPVLVTGNSRKLPAQFRHANR